jgi:hypothetical protein
MYFGDERRCASATARCGGRGHRDFAHPEVSAADFGNFYMAMMDNFAYQPGADNWVINENGEGSVPRICSAVIPMRHDSTQSARRYIIIWASKQKTRQP